MQITKMAVDAVPLIALRLEFLWAVCTGVSLQISEQVITQQHNRLQAKTRMNSEMTVMLILIGSQKFLLTQLHFLTIWYTAREEKLLWFIITLFEVTQVKMGSILSLVLFKFLSSSYQSVLLIREFLLNTDH